MSGSVATRSKSSRARSIFEPSSRIAAHNEKYGLVSARPACAAAARGLRDANAEDQALAIPSHAQSRFTVECDLAPLYQQKYQRDPDFKLYYALAHYHTLGIGLTLEAVKPDGTAATVFTTSHTAGDTLGGPIDPLFDMTGYTKLRMSCNYVNPRDTIVGWGIGDQEMCVFLAFSDSRSNIGGGATDKMPGDPTVVDTNVMSYTHACQTFAIDAQL